ncbi:uncharacterized protein LOC136087626 [Hydra vulgaris]|uniref:Uncharacterized protein LOC136087626 n=1 Tax=Hydra vulgaris TaxID=6087 RepID=A0ABM4CYL2_HYDVU
MNESSSKFLQLARGNNSLAIKDIATLAEPVLSITEAELELKNELAKAVPSVAVLSILNRSLFHHQIFDQIPHRLRIAPSLLIEELKRFFPQHENIFTNSRWFLKVAFSDNVNVVSSIMELQKMFVSKKSKAVLFLLSHVSKNKLKCGNGVVVKHSFHKQEVPSSILTTSLVVTALNLFFCAAALFVKSDSIDEELTLPSLYGPQVVIKDFFYGIRSRAGEELCSSQLTCMEEVLAAIVAVYYLKDLSYPSCFAQLLGIFQETILKVKYPYKSKAASRYVLQINSL